MQASARAAAPTDWQWGCHHGQDGGAFRPCQKSAGLQQAVGWHAHHLPRRTAYSLAHIGHVQAPPGSFVMPPARHRTAFAASRSSRRNPRRAPWDALQVSSRPTWGPRFRGTRSARHPPRSPPARAFRPRQDGRPSELGDTGRRCSCSRSPARNRCCDGNGPEQTCERVGSRHPTCSARRSGSNVEGDESRRAT